MSDNKDLEDRINELERAILQKRIAELEAELGIKPGVRELESKPESKQESKLESKLEAKLEPRPNVKEKQAVIMPMWARLAVSLAALTMVGIIIYLTGGVSNLASRFGLTLGSTSSPTPGPGCTDPKAANYDPSASRDNGKCTYEEIPADFPRNIPNGDYSMSCNGQHTQSFSNTNISQFIQELKSTMESAFAQADAACSSGGCTCSHKFDTTPWNGTSFTMTYTLSSTCCSGGQCSSYSMPALSCSITENK